MHAGPSWPGNGAAATGAAGCRTVAARFRRPAVRGPGCAACTLQMFVEAINWWIRRARQRWQNFAVYHTLVHFQMRAQQRKAHAKGPTVQSSLDRTLQEEHVPPARIRVESAAVNCTCNDNGLGTVLTKNITSSTGLACVSSLLLNAVNFVALICR